MGRIVQKFGGSSVADAESIKRVAMAAPTHCRNRSPDGAARVAARWKQSMWPARGMTLRPRRPRQQNLRAPRRHAESAMHVLKSCRQRPAQKPVPGPARVPVGKEMRK